jgi:MinD-like ATPase involved in chromosome partitioning or flagellar assembly
MLSSFTPNIIMNKVTCESDGGVGGKLKAIIEKYLSIDAFRLGEVTEDPIVKAAARKMIPFNVLATQCDAAVDIKEIVKRLRQADSCIRQPMAMATDTAQMEK